MYVNEDYKRVARGLAKANRYDPDRPMEVMPGLSVPTWIAYLSEAEAIVIQQEAMKHK